MSLETAKTLPHNREAEACVLGAMLIDNDAIGSVTELLEASDFYERAYRTIYEATLTLFEQDHDNQQWDRDYQLEHGASRENELRK